MSNERIIVVLGMHRSGTSVAARGLEVMGVDLGDRLMPAFKGINDKGFWEDIDINAINIEILDALGSDWRHIAPIEAIHVERLCSEGYVDRAVELLRQKSSGSHIFGFKDPRVAQILPFWKEVFRCGQFDVNYVLVIRHPLSVIKSLAKRDGISEEQSYLLWLNYVITSLTGSVGNKRVLVDYDRLMQSPDSELMKIAKCLNLEIDSKALQTYKDEFIDQGLRHTIFSMNDLLLDHDCPPIVREIYIALHDVASGIKKLDDEEFQNKISNWREEHLRFRTALLLVDKLLVQSQLVDKTVNELHHALSERDNQIASLNQSIVIQDEQIASLNQTVTDIYNSNSWRITRPLREIMRIAMRYFDRLKRSKALVCRTVKYYQHHGFYHTKRRITEEACRIYKTSFLGLKNQVAAKGYVDIFGTFTHDPLVSIIAINYNGAKDLPEFLLALRRQTYNNFELIILDNGSVDNSKEIIREHQPYFNHIRLVEAGRNTGFAEGNNLAREYAKGEFYALLNVDTKVQEDWLRSMIEAARSDGSAAAIASKILFWSKFRDISIEADNDFYIDLKVLLESLEYQKYFLRKGIVDNSQVNSIDNRVVISVPVQVQPISLSFSSREGIGVNVRILEKDSIILESSLSTSPTIVSLDLFAITKSTGAFIINNAGSVADHDGLPGDRGFGEYDSGQYDSKRYVPFFCGCSVLIRSAAVVDRPLFIAEFFAYYEDSELSRWIIDSGYHILYTPGSIVYHKHSATCSEGSLVWQYLVKRSYAIYSYKGNLSLLESNIDLVNAELGHCLSAELAMTLSEYDKRLIGRLVGGGDLQEQRKSVGVYNSFWNTFGGGESHPLSIASKLQKKYPVVLISETDFDIDALARYYSLDLSNCRKLVISTLRSDFTRKFYLFINATYGSCLRSYAINSWYIVSFPQRTEVRDFIKDYYFLYNSKYTKKWAKKYWGSDIDGEIVFPVRAINQDKMSLIKVDKKEKIILSVGRFFPLGHCKNQDKIVDAFRSLVLQLPEASNWKLVLIGSLNFGQPRHVAYFKDVETKANGLNVELHPNVAHNVLEEYYTKASIYVHAAGLGQDPEKKPENFEHFGITPLEAMLYGCIPVVYDVGGPADLVEELGIGYTFSSNKTLVFTLEELVMREFSSLISECDVVKQLGSDFVKTELRKKLPIDRLQSNRLDS